MGALFKSRSRVRKLLVFNKNDFPLARGRLQNANCKEQCPNIDHFGTAEFIAEAGATGEKKIRGAGRRVLWEKRPPRPSPGNRKASAGW